MQLYFAYFFIFFKDDCNFQMYGCHTHFRLIIAPYSYYIGKLWSFALIIIYDPSFIESTLLSQFLRASPIHFVL